MPRNPLATAASWFYARALRLRSRAYGAGWLPVWRPPVFCIAVGNISWGGSGKTPLCAWLLKWCVQQGYRPALLTRGYRARPSTLPYLVQSESPVRSAGDEPLMLQRECPRALIVVDPCRSRGGRWAWQKFRPDMFILDDGMQHLAVYRDLNLVLLRPGDLERDWNRVIPAGPWREDYTALNRASAFVCNVPGRDWPQVGGMAWARLAAYRRPVFGCQYTVLSLRPVVDGTQDQPQGRSYLLVSGVGSPERVEQTAQSALGRPALAHLRYGDHHSFGLSDWERIKGKARELGAEFILCTPKDAVKLEAWADRRLWTFNLDLNWHRPGEQGPGFEKWLYQRLQMQKTEDRGQRTDDRKINRRESQI